MIDTTPTDTQGERVQTQWVSWASIAIAVGSLLYARRSARTGLRSLDVASTIGQVNYENARANHTPAATLTLTEVEHRAPTAPDPDGLLGYEARSWAERHESDSVEVVARGRLVNNTEHELLLTLHDHPQSHRRGRYRYRNQSVLVLDGTPTELNRAILPAGAEAAFEWIDRRTQREWITISDLKQAHDGTSSPFVPALSWRDYVRAPFDRFSAMRVAERKIDRSGFYLVCESRANERVATIWYAEVVETPITIDDHNIDTGQTTYKPSHRKFPGPIDDEIIRYRVTFDPVLALLRTPKKRYLRGRD
jgi:hypothetical protein